MASRKWIVNVRSFIQDQLFFSLSQFVTQKIQCVQFVIPMSSIAKTNHSSACGMSYSLASG